MNRDVAILGSSCSWFILALDQQCRRSLGSCATLNISNINHWIPDQFNPERWIENRGQIHPFSVRPFGHGPRMCIGRRFAELEIQLGIVKLLQNFKIELASNDDKDEVHLVSKMISVPDKPVRLKFIDL